MKFALRLKKIRKDFPIASRKTNKFNPSSVARQPYSVSAPVHNVHVVANGIAENSNYLSGISICVNECAGKL